MIRGSWKVTLRYMRHGPLIVEGETPADSDGSVFFGSHEMEVDDSDDRYAVDTAHKVLTMTVPVDTVWMQVMGVEASFEPAEEEVAA